MRSFFLFNLVLLFALSLSHAVAFEPVPRPAYVSQEDRGYRIAFQKARTAIRERQFDEALEKLTPLIAQYPNRAGSRLLYAQALIGLGEWEEARHELLLMNEANGFSPKIIRRATFLLQKIQAFENEQRRRTAPASAQSGPGFNMSQRFGLDANARRAPQDERIIYYLNNIDSLAPFNLGPTLLDAPGNSGNDSDDEIFYETTISANYRMGDLLTLGEVTRFNATYLTRNYDSFDDNGDGEGDGDFIMSLANLGITVPVVNKSFGANLKMTQLKVADETASRSVELRTSLQVPLADKPTRKSSLSVSVAGTRNHAEALAQAPTNEQKSGGALMLQTGYQNVFKKSVWVNHLQIYRQEHRDKQLNFNRLGLRSSFSHMTEKWRYSADLNLQRRIDDKAASSSDFAAIWGPNRRADNSVSLNLALSRPFRLFQGAAGITFSVSQEWKESNLERYDISATQWGLTLSQRWQ